MEFQSSSPATADASPLVTVIIPTIGRPRYVVDTLRSVLIQTYSNLQILISDNAPTVATVPLLVAAGITDCRIEVVERAQRLASSVHMNACIAQARGTYLMILSDDDQIAAGYIEEMVSLLTSRPDVTVALGRQVKIKEDDQGMVSDDSPVLTQRVINGVEFLKGTLSGTLQSQVLTYISLFARKDHVLRAGAFKDYPDGSHADNFLFFNLALRGHVALGSSLMFYRVYLTSTGLGTPFSALLAATRAYTSDCARALQGASSIDNVDKQRILRLVERGNFQMLLSRLRHVYRRRMSVAEFLRCLLQVAQFRLMRAHVI